LLGADSLVGAIADQLLAGIEGSLERGEPARYGRVLLHNADRTRLLAARPDLAERLGELVHQVALETGVPVTTRLSLAIESAGHVPQGTAVVEVSPERFDKGITVAQPAGDADALRTVRTLDAFLIVGGKHHFALDRPLTRLGRRLDNDLVLDDPGVSREHAQIRWRFGRFVVIDLNSRGGTFVNGEAVDESVLTAGDVIRLSKVSLIYGEGRGTRPRRASPDGREGSETLVLHRGDEA
jgi:hypothetical protein